MSRDLWLKQLRIAGADTRSIEDVLTDHVPVDGLRHAGSALLRAEPSDVVVTIARSLIEVLGDRNWTGDKELVAELEHDANHTTPDLIALPAALDELGEALDQSAGSEAFIDMTNGALWPAQLFDVDHGPVDFDPTPDRWLLVVGLGSTPAYETMRRFVTTIQQPDLMSRLTDALGGSGAFRRFHTKLSRHEREYTRRHRFRDDARLGRARAWLADRGYQSIQSSAVTTGLDRPDHSCCP